MQKYPGFCFNTGIYVYFTLLIQDIALLRMYSVCVCVCVCVCMRVRVRVRACVCVHPRGYK